MQTALAQVIGDGVVWDNHACMPLRPDDRDFLPQLERVRQAGVNVVALNVAFGTHGPADADAMLDLFDDWIDKHPETLMRVATVADADTARANGKLGIHFNLESMSALGGDIARVEHFYRRGVRWMLGTYNLANAVGGGCMEEDKGLTEFGRQVIAEMNRIGMVVCGSHCGYRTARDMIDASATPMIFSHSNARAVWDHPRNIPDDLIKACAERGGVIGINGIGPFLGANDASTDAYVAHVEHMLDLVGDDHVGIALDYVFDIDELNDYIASDPVTFPPETFPSGMAMIEPERLPEIARALKARQYSAETLAKLFGGNHRRIAATVWK